MDEVIPIQPIPDEYLKAIGEVTIRWNSLEGLLHLCLIKLLGKDILEGRSHVVFAHMSFPQKLDSISALIGELTNLPANSPLNRYKEEIQPLLKQAQSKRNLIIHSIWGVDEKGRVCVSSVSARGTLKMKNEPISLKEVQAIPELITQAGMELFLSVVYNGKRPPQTGQ
jgi:hypothetical protein